MGIIEVIKGFIALLFLQSSWSYIGRQTLGILYVIILLAKNRNVSEQSEPTKNQLKERIWQKMSLNTNPYCTGVMLGIALNQQGEIFKESYFSLQHIFGAVGDEFFWRTFRPAMLSFAILLLLVGYFHSSDFYKPGIFLFAPLVFLIPYNIVAQGTRIRGLYQGKKYGKQAAVFLVEDLRKPISKLYNALAFIMGILLAMLPIMFIQNLPGQILPFGKMVLSIGLILVLVAFSYLALRTERASSYLFIGGLLIFLIIKLL